LRSQAAAALAHAPTASAPDPAQLEACSTTGGIANVTA
jgi:hypothetical protein